MHGTARDDQRYAAQRLDRRASETVIGITTQPRAAARCGCCPPPPLLLLALDVRRGFGLDWTGRRPRGGGPTPRTLADLA